MARPDTSATEGYEITVIGRHVQVTDAMKDYAKQKVSKIDRFTNRAIEATVTMDIVKLEHHVDITLKVDHTLIKVSASTDNMYSAIDKATDRLSRKLRQYRTRLTDHHSKALHVVDMNVNVLEPTDELLEDVNEEIEEENLRREEQLYQPHKVVARETRPLKTLTVEEAMMKMDLSGHNFMIFRSEIDQKLKVIYRRTDENYGIIEPE